MTTPAGVSPRVLRAGVALALIYVAVALATAQLSSRPLLPLFDGFAPPTPYAWVNPPRERAGDNVAPKAAEREFPVTAEGSAAVNASTDDAQAIVGLDKGSVPARPPDTGVVVRVVPIDAGTLGALPPGLRVVSNAYQVRISYLPSQTPLNRLAVKGTIALTAADAGNRLLYSADGQTWEERTFRPFGQDHGLFTELEAVGWFVVATSVTPAGDTAGSVRKGMLLVTVFVVTVVAAFLVVRLPSPAPATPAARRPGTAPRPGRKKPRKPRR